MKERNEKEIKEMVAAYREKKQIFFDQIKEPITESNIETYKNDFEKFQGNICYRCGKDLFLKNGYLIKPYKHCKSSSKNGKNIKDIVRIVCHDCAFIMATYEMEKKFESRDYLLIRAYHKGFTIYDDDGAHRKEVIKKRLFALYYPKIKKYEKSFIKELASAGLNTYVDFQGIYSDKYLTRAIETVDWKGEKMEDFDPRTFSLYQYIIFTLQTCKRDLIRQELRAVRIKKATKIKGLKQAAKRIRFLSTANNEDGSENEFSASNAGYLTPEEEFIRKEEERIIKSPEFIGEFRKNVKSKLSKNYVPVYEFILRNTYKNQHDIAKKGGFSKDTVSRAFKQIKEAENYYRNKML